MRVLTTKLRVEIENEMRIILESLNFEIEMRVSQKSGLKAKSIIHFTYLGSLIFDCLRPTSLADIEWRGLCNSSSSATFLLASVLFQRPGQRERGRKTKTS